ncbi:unnamed protein product, partial [Amoebophrya sp. A120]
DPPGSSRQGRKLARGGVWGPGVGREGPRDASARDPGPPRLRAVDVVAKGPRGRLRSGKKDGGGPGPDSVGGRIGERRRRGRVICEGRREGRRLITLRPRDPHARQLCGHAPARGGVRPRFGKAGRPLVLRAPLARA